jgi:hypothetical protein
MSQEIFADWDPDEVEQFNRQCRRVTRASWRILGIEGPDDVSGPDRKGSKSARAVD